MPKQTPDQLIAAANQRLKRDCWGVTIQRLGDRLYLRAVLPAPPGNANPNPRQQRIATHLRANAEGIKQAEAEAKLLGARLTAGKFNWADYREPGSVAAGSVGYWRDRFRDDLLNRQGKRPGTWTNFYWRWLQKLPADAPLSPAVLIRFLESYPVNSASRYYAASACGAFARFCGLEFRAADWRGSYSRSRDLSPRDLPSDDLVFQVWRSIEDPSWRWVFGMLAAYGLRNHEVARIESFDGPVLQIGENSKTGSRQVWPCYPEWFELMLLADWDCPDLPDSSDNSRIGRIIGQGLRKVSPIQPYNLRHAWAVRTMLYGWPVELAARQMGHSVKEHTQTYHRWINAEQQQKVFEELSQRQRAAWVRPTHAAPHRN